jgi:hypothetical protein
LTHQYNGYKSATLFRQGGYNFTVFEKIVNEKKRLTTITVAWKADFSELMSVLKNFFDDNNTEYLLLDLRNSSLDSITPDHVINLCKYAKSRANGEGRVNGKTALVGSSDLQFGIGRMFETYSEMEESSIKVSVFRSMEKALCWLEEG